MTWNNRVVGLLATSCFLLAGCSGSGRPAIAPVRGTVTYQGKPVAGATVVFLCPGAPRLAVGTTDESGNYRLTTYEPNDGAMIGTHVVTVKKYASDSGGDVNASAEPMDQRAMAEAIEKSMRQSAQQAKQAEKTGSLLPSKYAHQKTSGLRKVVVDGQNVVDIELTD
jgi:hypothetical protein